MESRRRLGTLAFDTLRKRFRLFTCSWVFCFLCSCSLFAQSPSQTKVTPDYSREAFVSEEDVTRIAFENDGTSTRESTTRIRIQSGAGVQRFGVLTFPYESSTGTVDIDYVRVRKPDGTTVLTPLDSVQDMPSEITRQAPFYSDLHEKHVAVKGLGVGDLLEFQAHWRTTKPLAPGQFWFAFNFSHDAIFLHEELQVSVPRQRPLNWKSPQLKPTISETGSRRLFSWTASQLEHKSTEQERKDQEQTSYQTQRGKLPPPEIQLSTFQTWQEIGRWYMGLQQDRAKPSPEIRAKAFELTKSATDDDGKLRVLYAYVSTQFRYIGVSFGIGRYQPHPATDVLSNQYGDCKDKHTLLASLLDAVGIKAFPAFINSAGEIDPDVPSPAQFDHLITAVPRGDHLIWLDTTLEVAPYAYLISALRDKQALVVSGDNSSLTSTPDVPPSKASQTFRMEAQLSDSGTLEGKVDRTIQGDDHEVLLRSAFRSVPMAQWKDLIQRISYGIGFAGDVSDVAASTPEKIDEPFHLSYTYTRKEYPDWSNGRVSSPLPPLALPAAFDKDGAPTNPIWLGAPAEIRLQSVVKLPAGYAPELPAKVDLNESFAEYHASYSVKDGALITDRDLIVKLQEVPFSQYEAYNKFTKTVANDHELFVALSSAQRKQLEGLPLMPIDLPSTGSKSTLDSYQNAIWNLPLSEKSQATSAYQDAQERFQNRDLQGEIASPRRAVEIDPKFTRAWLWLGEIYKATRQTDEALKAYRTAIDIEPQQPVSYKALGCTLLALQKYEDAVPVWQQLLKLAPNDPAAAAGLGSALLSLKRYAEAASILEKAVSLNPQQSRLVIQLGFAYLGAGNDDKALASLDKGIDLDPQPTILNNVAWELAEATKHLPLALQYAQQAVNDEERASQDIDLAELKTEDLGFTPRLAAYWDTLGWVYFRMGKIPEAKKYLNSAWTLSLDGWEADHLGQLYEFQHNNEAAIRMYKLALYSFPLQSLSRAGEIEKTRERLRHLLPGVSITERNSFNEVTDMVNGIRTIKLPRLVPGNATAEFFLIFTQDPKSASLKVDDVKFISGSDELKAKGKSLQSAKFTFPFPDDAQPSILRRGILSCYKYTGCSFTLINPGDVYSIN
jgi:tetratricopeptide (TPR) repeat protein